MPINITDEFHAATTKGKIASAKEVFLTGDTENLQQIGEKTHQLEDSIKDIAATGGASTATAVTFDNAASGMIAVNAQGAIEELNTKNKSQDTEIAKKANSVDVNSKINEESTRVDAEIAKKVDKTSIVQEFGEFEDKVVSQFALPFREIESPEFIHCIVDSENHPLFGIQLDGSIEWGKGIPTPIKDKMQEIINQSQQDKTDLSETINTLNGILNKTTIKDDEGVVVDTPFHYIQSEEFIFAKVDADNKLLFGIQWDGTPVFGKTSVVEDRLQVQVNLLAEKITTILGDDDTTSTIDTLKELKDFFANIDNTQILTNILANLNAIIDKIAVKDEAGEIKDTPFRVIENDEFLCAIVDADGRILFGISKETGKPYYPLNDMYHVEQNEEYFAAWLDTDNHMLLGIRRDGQIIGDIHAVNALKQVVSAIQEKVDTIYSNTKELLDVFSLKENPEYLSVETDADGKIIASTNVNGSHYIHNAKSETIPEEFNHIEDPEGRMEITTDANERVMSYRDSNGKKYEHDMNITNLEVSNLDLQGDSINDIQDALKANGFDVKTPIDWSESSFIQIPEPRFAIANITNIDSMPTTKTDNKKAFFEFWDMQGNYFKKHTILNAQGRSSMRWEKKNISLDLCDDEWIGDETPKVRFGNWVPQDGFHVKAYYTDVVRGLCPISYKLYEQIVRTRGDKYDRPWKKALIDYSKIGATSKSFGNPYVGNYDLLTDTGARCFPDGFPIAIYLNGKFYGVFALQLKKHRDNYHLNKSTAEHVHLDGILDEGTIFNGKGNIDWSQFEVRNPKGLYAIGGNKYDADVKQEEIAGDTEVNAWIEAGTLPNGKTIDSKIKKALQMTAKVKKYILNFAETVPTIKSAMATYEASSKSEEDLKALKSVYEKYFDVQNMEDYMIIGDILGNGDGFAGNWQWFTYDGVKWWVGLYDCDLVFGGNWEGKLVSPPSNRHIDISTNKPNGYVVKYYYDDMKARYKELADNNIISINNIVSVLKDWCMRIGTSFYKKEYEKWKDSPCLSDSVVNEEYWKLLYDSDGNPQTDTSETFNATKAYNIGDVVSFGLNSNMGFFKFTCIKATVASSENKPHEVSSYSPVKAFKHSDNIYRIERWIETKIPYMDTLYEYNRINNL